MGGLVSSLGFGPGGSTADAGTKFAAESANVAQPINLDQTNSAYSQAQDALSQQQNFVNALQAQNAIGNQSNVYNQLSGVVNGTGPNPAQAMLAQQTGANVANQAALMAGQRGAGSNVGLIARQAAQQGGSLQQQAVGQGATMQANQSLNALNMQGGLATQQVGQQANAIQNLNTGRQNEQQNLLNAIAAQNNANVAMRSNQNSANGQVANSVAQGQQALAGNLMGGAGAAMGLAHGGEVPHLAEGGGVSVDMGPSIPQVPVQDPNAPQSNVAKYHKSKEDGSTPATPAYGGSSNPGADALAKGSQQFMQGAAKGAKNLFSSGPAEGNMAGGPMDAGGAQSAAMFASRGGQVPAMVSPGEMYLPPDKAQAVAQKRASPMQEGEMIPGKAKVKGDSLKNDTVSKTLESGGVVIPRSIMESKDAEKKAAAFVAAHLAKTRKSLPSKKKA